MGTGGDLAHDHGMNTTSPHPNELVRPRAGRMIAGVAAGIAERLGVSVTMIRLAFIGLFFIGGGGLALYLLGWIAIRSDDHPRSLAERWLGSNSVDLGRADADQVDPGQESRAS